MPEVPGAPELRDHTTLRLGGPGREWVRATTEDELVAAVSEADAAGTPVLVLGGGSNLVVADAGFDGRVVEVATTGVTTDADDSGDPTCSGATVTVAAGEGWDELVAEAVARGWVGVEALSGIPGSVGATPIQNVGAYGQEVSETIAARAGVGPHAQRRALVRGGGVPVRLPVQPLQGRPRPPRRPRRHLPAPAGGAGRAGPLRRARPHPGGRGGAARPARRRTLPRSSSCAAARGWCSTSTTTTRWSAGSFFTNPFLTPQQAAALPADAPRWEQPDGTVKSSAGWLIEHAGFGKGWTSAAAGERVSLSTKHTLALTNRGGATTDELLTLAREVRDGVESRFGVRLVNEPVTVGCAL